MLKSILILGISLLTLSTYSQFERDVKQIGFSTAISASNNKIEDLTSNLLYVRMTPSFHYFVKDNFSIGGTFLFSSNQSIQKINTASSGSKTLIYGLGISANKYFKMKDYFFFTVNSMVSFSNSRSETISSYSNAASKSTVFGVSLAPSLVYLFTPKIGLTASFGSLYFTNARPVGVSNSSYTSYGANFGFSSLNFGLIYNF